MSRMSLFHKGLNLLKAEASGKENTIRHAQIEVREELYDLLIMADRCGSKVIPCYSNIREELFFWFVVAPCELMKSNVLLDMIGELLLMLNECIEEMEHKLEELEKQKEELW